MHRRGDELERPFCCSLCTKAFSTVSSLALHMRLKHLKRVTALVPPGEAGAQCAEHGADGSGSLPDGRPAARKPTPAEIRSFAIASNWKNAIVHNSLRYQKRLRSSAYGRACLWAMVQPLGLLQKSGTCLLMPVDARGVPVCGAPMASEPLANTLPA